MKRYGQKIYSFIFTIQTERLLPSFTSEKEHGILPDKIVGVGVEKNVAV